MPLVRFASHLSSVRGRVGKRDDGLIYYELDGRGVCRAAPETRKPGTAAQQKMRMLQGELSRRFSKLPRSCVETWNTFAARFHREDPLGNPYQLNGFQAYKAINTHRILSGNAPRDDPPEYWWIPAPERLRAIAATSNGCLELTLDHAAGSGVGFWRIHISPPLPTPARAASPRLTRTVTEETAESYVEIAPSPQTIVLRPKTPYRTGQTVGVEILSLSRDYVPGGKLFICSILIGSPI